jgi:methionyl-tRNA formyltransferase
MRIIVNGMQPFGAAVLEKLVERGENIVGVYCPADKDGRVDKLTEAARAHDLPVFQPKSFKTEEVVEHVKSLEPDLAVMAYVLKFVPEDFLYVPKLGSIQYHPSLLPLHRGPSSINWPIIEGKSKTGLTIFWPDNGLDTGPVLLQKEVDIGPDATLGSIYFDRLFPMGVDAMIEAVDLVRDGKAPKIIQDEALSTYESWCRKENVGIDWALPGQQVYNLIRGANPQPGAWTSFGGRTVEIFDCRLAGEANGRPGEITAIDSDSFTVAASSGGIQIQRVRCESRQKVSGGEFATEAGLKTGDVLLTVPVVKE